MLENLQALMDWYVKNPEVEKFFRVFSGNELRDFFEEKWENVLERYYSQQKYDYSR